LHVRRSISEREIKELKKKENEREYEKEKDQRSKPQTILSRQEERKEITTKRAGELKKIACITERNISTLDSEIGAIKAELEEAAISQTQNIISGILKSVLNQ